MTGYAPAAAIWQPNFSSALKSEAARYTARFSPLTPAGGPPLLEDCDAPVDEAAQIEQVWGPSGATGTGLRGRSRINWAGDKAQRRS